jgi:DNA-binding transcriptional MerR regulator
MREAAATLGSSPTALRAWEARYGYPVSQISGPGHERTYRREEVLALAEALQGGLSIASAIDTARTAVTRQST